METEVEEGDGQAWEKPKWWHLRYWWQYWRAMGFLKRKIKEAKDLPKPREGEVEAMDPGEFRKWILESKSRRQ